MTMIITRKVTTTFTTTTKIKKKENLFETFLVVKSIFPLQFSSKNLSFIAHFWNKADCHKLRAPSNQQTTNGQTNQQSGL